MVTITPHTTRATGTVLTASIYNTDHQNHVTNATNIDAVAVYRDQSNNFSTGTTQTLQGTSVLRIEATGDVTLASTAHGLQVGLTSGSNIAMDNNEIQARNNGAANRIDINNLGGDVHLGSASSTVVVAGTLSVTGTFSYSGALSGTDLTLTSTDAGTTAGPDIILYRNSASPAALDDLGRIVWDGEDSVGNQETYARLFVELVDPTSASEDASYIFQTKVAGAFVTWGFHGLTGGGLRIAPNNNTAEAFDISSTGDTTTNGNATITGTLSVTGGSTLTGNATFNGHAQLADANSHLIFATADSDTYFDYAGLSGEVRFVSDNVECWRATNTGINVGRTTASTTAVGTSVQKDGNLISVASAQQVVIANRLTDDGVIMSIRQASVEEGSISVAGTTVSFNSFLGSHWSQLVDNSRPDIPIGTICNSVSQMCVWDHEERVNDRLPCFEICNEENSKAVYGVFIGWDNDDDRTNDAYIAALGAGWVRIRLGEDVQVGDLICSAGNGCGKVQDDDVFHSYTVAKVTSTEVVEIYEDGSFRVPATLHCG